MAANRLKLAHEQAGAGAALVCQFRGLNKDRLLLSTLLLWRTAALTEWRLVLLCGLMFALETDIIFVYTIVSGFSVITFSSLQRDDCSWTLGVIVSLFFVPRCFFCVATYVAREGIPINFQWETSTYRIMLTSCELTTLWRKPVQSQVGQKGRMKDRRSTESALALTELRFTRFVEVVLIGKFLQSCKKKKLKPIFHTAKT